MCCAIFVQFIYNHGGVLLLVKLQGDVSKVVGNFLDIYISSENLFNTLCIEIKQMLRKFASDKINFTKNALFFLSQAQIHHSFPFNLRLLYKLKHEVSLSKNLWEIFQVRFYSVFISLYFRSTKNMEYLTFKRHNSFQN